jgi:hypothetical protein
VSDRLFLAISPGLHRFDELAPIVDSLVVDVLGTDAIRYLLDVQGIGPT